MSQFDKFMKKEDEEETENEQENVQNHQNQTEDDQNVSSPKDQLADMETNIQASQMIDLENLADKYGVELKSVASKYDSIYGAYEIFGQKEAHEMTLTNVENKLEKLGEVVYRRVLILGKYWEYWSEKPNQDDKPERVNASVLALVYDPDEEKNILQELRYTDRDGTKMYEALKRVSQLTVYDDVKLRLKNGFYNLDVNTEFGNPTFLAEIDEKYEDMSEQQAFVDLMGEDFKIHNSWQNAGFSTQNNGFTDRTDIKAVRVIVRKGDYRENKKAPENSEYKNVYKYQADCIDFSGQNIRLVFPSFPEFEIPKLFGRNNEVYLVAFGPIDHFAGVDKLTVYQANKLTKEEARNSR